MTTSAEVKALIISHFCRLLPLSSTVWKSKSSLSLAQVRLAISVILHLLYTTFITPLVYMPPQESPTMMFWVILESSFTKAITASGWVVPCLSGDISLTKFTLINTFWSGFTKFCKPPSCKSTSLTAV